MPTLRGVECAVLIDSKQLREWGEEKSGSTPAVSCYVQSEPEKGFSLLIRPKMPYSEELWNERQTRSAKVRAACIYGLFSVC